MPAHHPALLWHVYLHTAARTRYSIYLLYYCKSTILTHGVPPHGRKDAGAGMEKPEKCGRARYSMCLLYCFTGTKVRILTQQTLLG